MFTIYVHTKCHPSNSVVRHRGGSET